MDSINDIRTYLDKFEKDVEQLKAVTNYNELSPLEKGCVKEVRDIQLLCNRMYKELYNIAQQTRRSVSGTTTSITANYVNKILSGETDGSGDNRSEAEEVAKPVRSKRKTTKKA